MGYEIMGISMCEIPSENVRLFPETNTEKDCKQR